MSEPDPMPAGGHAYTQQPMLSVIICTHNPHRERLARTLGGLSAQTLPRHLWELVIVDNGSVPAVAGTVQFPGGLLSPLIVPEPELGLTPARLAGIRSARGDVLVFVDDDNVLAPTYLQEALRLFATEPQVGAAGGIIEAEYEEQPPQWAAPYLGLLGIRDFGDRPMRALVYNAVGPWEPIGAGMVIRSDVARHYAEIAQDRLRRSLDRRGTGLGSCGDTDMARCAPEMGYYLAYQPALRLTHLIPAFRIRFRYLMRLSRALKRSGILLDRIRTGQPPLLQSAGARAARLAVAAIRKFNPSPQRWLVEMAAVYGELEARAVREA